jgi:hypothetical protein
MRLNEIKSAGHRRERLDKLTVDERFKNTSPILLNQVIDVTKDSTAFEKPVRHISGGAIAA